MSKAHHFDMISAEIAHSDCLPPTAKRIKYWSTTERVKELSQDLGGRIKSSGNLTKIKAPDPLVSVWSLLSKTSWPTTTTKASSLKNLCAVALMETEKQVLTAREKVLASKYTMDLRFSIWLSTSLTLKWNSSNPNEAQELDWWDMCPDQVVEEEMIYQGEMVEKISRLFDENTQALTELGDFLTTCRALTNNGDVPPAERIISSEIKDAIDTILKVGRFAESLIGC